MSSSENENFENNSFSIYQIELEKKDQQILELQNQINSLIQNKNNCLYQAEKVNNLSQISQTSYSNSFQNNNINHNNLISLVQLLQHENTLLKNKLNLELKIDNKNSNSIQNKLFCAQKEIEILTKMNNDKDNIILNMQIFINNINKVISNEKINLNLNILDIKTYVANLKELEKKVISKLPKIPKFNKIPNSFMRKGKENSVKKQKTDISFNSKSHLNKIPLYNKNTNIKMKSNCSLNSSINTNKSLNKNNLFHSKNKNEECKDIRCTICRNKSKNDAQFYKQRKKIRLRGFLSTKPEEVYSRTPKKEHIKSVEGEYYNNYLKSINNGNGLYATNIEDNDSTFKN